MGVERQGERERVGKELGAGRQGGNKGDKERSWVQGDREKIKGEKERGWKGVRCRETGRR